MQGIGGAIPGYLLALAGFDAAAKTQPDSVITVIILCLIGLPALVDLLAIVIFGKGYPLTKEKLEEQNRILAEKRGTVQAE